MARWYESGDISSLSTMPPEKILCVDVETTGVDPSHDEIVQIGIIRGDGEVLASHYIRPERHVDWPAAQRVHGITPATVAGCPPLTHFARKLQSYFAGARLVVGYNVSFDLAFLRAAGILHESVPTFDVMREFAPVAGRWDPVRRRYAWVSLEYCARYYSFHGRAHDALEDAQATLWCFWSMLERGGGSPVSSSACSYLNIVERFAKRR